MISHSVCLMYCSMLRLRISSRGPSSLLKESRSMDANLSEVLAETVAARGVLRSRANSPKYSPDLYSLTFLPAIVAVASPLIIM